jgi:hypothetical protein
MRLKLSLKNLEPFKSPSVAFAVLQLIHYIQAFVNNLRFEAFMATECSRLVLYIYVTGRPKKKYCVHKPVLNQYNSFAVKTIYDNISPLIISE